MQLRDVVRFESGSAQFRIKESLSPLAPLYFFYTQMELSDDLTGVHSKADVSKKSIRTYDDVIVVKKGDIVFSLISGLASKVGSLGAGRLITQNYVKLVPSNRVAPSFLVYLLNQEKMIKKQFFSGLQGSSVVKYTLAQLKILKIPELPPLETQIRLGEVYFMQLRREALKRRVAELETICVMNALERLITHE